jgi:hypothetical protein
MDRHLGQIGGESSFDSDLLEVEGLDPAHAGGEFSGVRWAHLRRVRQNILEMCANRYESRVLQTGRQEREPYRLSFVK